MSDTNKTDRSFKCREALWHKFEQMAAELDCSVDYLINDAMKQYARQRGYGTRGLGSAPSASAPPLPNMAGPTGVLAPPAPPLTVPQRSPAGPPQGPGRAAVGGPPPPPPMAPPPMAPPPPPQTRLSAPPRGPGAATLPISPLAPGAPPPPPPPPPAAPPRARHDGSARNHALPAAGSLNLYYMGERFPITKERFVIGRGKQSSDLTIKDPNVSRQHALVEFLNGQYFMVDMGSTNGVEYEGQRIQRQVIGEGDVFHVCDHELRFSSH